MGRALSGQVGNRGGRSVRGDRLGHGAYAQDWPNKPIRMIVPYPPAGGTDIVARVLNEKLAPALGAAIIVDNKGGAAGKPGHRYCGEAPADRCTRQRDSRIPSSGAFAANIGAQVTRAPPLLSTMIVARAPAPAFR